MSKIYIIMGPPGCGKGTFCEKVESPNMKHISTGEILRQSKQFKSIDTGEFVSDDVVNKIVLEYLQEHADNNNTSTNSIENVDGSADIILDGYPRNESQVEFLMKNNIDIYKTIFFNNSKEVSVERILKRGRADDKKEVIERRFDIYEEKTVPVINALKKHGIDIVEINSENDKKEVYNECMEKVFN